MNCPSSYWLDCLIILLPLILEYFILSETSGKCRHRRNKPLLPVAGSCHVKMTEVFVACLPLEREPWSIFCQLSGESVEVSLRDPSPRGEILQ